MCKNCAKVVRDMDIRDTDLPYLPYALVKWQCLVPGCKCGCKVRDYGIAPYYYWPVHIHYYDKNLKFRGGWISGSEHWYLCGRHWDMIENRQIIVPERSPEIMLSRFIEIVKRKS